MVMNRLKAVYFLRNGTKKKQQQQSQLILYPNEHLGWNKTKISFTANTTEITGIIFFFVFTAAYLWSL